MTSECMQGVWVLVCVWVCVWGGGMCVLVFVVGGEWRGGGEEEREREGEGSAWLCLCLCLCSPSLPTHTHTRTASTHTHTHTHKHTQAHTHAHTSTHFPLPSPLLSFSLSLGWPCLLPPSPSLSPLLSSPLSHNRHTHKCMALVARCFPLNTPLTHKEEEKERGENTQHKQAAMQHKHITHHCMQ